MTSFMRKSVRRSAVVLGATAVAVGAAACGGSTETTEADPATEEQAEEATEESAAEEETTEDEAAEGEAEAFSDEDLQGASDRFYEFLEYTVTGDFEAACGMVLNPVTDEPMSGEEAEACAGGMEGTSASQLDESALDAISPEDIEATDNGDGTVAISMMGSDFPYGMTKGSDGEWYITM